MEEDLKKNIKMEDDLKKNELSWGLNLLFQIVYSGSRVFLTIKKRNWLNCFKISRGITFFNWAPPPYMYFCEPVLPCVRASVCQGPSSHCQSPPGPCLNMHINYFLYTTHFSYILYSRLYYVRPPTHAYLILI